MVFGCPYLYKLAPLVYPAQLPRDESGFKPQKAHLHPKVLRSVVLIDEEIVDFADLLVVLVVDGVACELVFSPPPGPPVGRPHRRRDRRLCRSSRSARRRRCSLRTRLLPPPRAGRRGSLAPFLVILSQSLLLYAPLRRWPNSPVRGVPTGRQPVNRRASVSNNPECPVRTSCFVLPVTPGAF